MWGVAKQGSCLGTGRANLLCSYYKEANIAGK